MVSANLFARDRKYRHRGRMNSALRALAQKSAALARELAARYVIVPLTSLGKTWSDPISRAISRDGDAVKPRAVC